MNTFIIAEIAQAHDGSLGILHSYIDALSKTGVNAVKFQTHIAEAESSTFEPFRIKFSYVDNTRFDYWKRMSFSLQQWKEIKKHCDEVGLEFMSSPFSIAAVNLLENIDIQRYKVGSGEVSNLLMLEKICKTKKPIILSSGLSSLTELDDAVNLVRSYGNPLSILQCTTSYPTLPEHLGLNVIQELKARYPDAKIGFSDHSAKIYTGIAAVALGAEILEFHAVFDRKMFGPDATSSLTINEISELVCGVRFIETALNHPVNKMNVSHLNELKNIFEKSLAVNRKMKKGNIISFEDLETKKPKGCGIDASAYKEIIGKRLIRDLNTFDFIKKEDLE